jgi:preprotein translocase SecF subunit
MEILKGTNIDFIGWRTKAFIISLVFVLVGFFALVMISLGNANLSVDFTGGTNVRVQFQESVDIGDLREALAKGGIEDVQIQHIAGTREFFIKTKSSDAQKEKADEKIISILNSSFQGKKFTVLETNMVGATVGKALKRYAILAAALSLIGIIGYIAWRFTFTFGVAATIATFHDVLFILGFFWLLGREINLLLITSLLTIAGYSLSDTVVVFDRIRENMAKMKSKADFGSVINRSINEVLSRTIVTGIATLLALAAIMALGGEVLFDFAFSLFLGLIVGAYSSIFVASPLAYLWRKRV